MTSLNGLIWIFISSNIVFAFSVRFPVNFTRRTSTDEYQLIAAHVLMRHGDRNIVRSFPNNRYADKIYWPGGYGALTMAGKKQMFELGQYLRRRYKNLISEHYSPNEVHVQSTDVKRCMRSAQCTLAGLYSSKSKQQNWESNCDRNSIPLHTIPVDFDYFLYPLANCPRHTRLLNKFLEESAEIKAAFEKHRIFIEFLQKHSGLESINLIGLTVLYDTLNVLYLKGFELQDWENKALNSKDTMEYFATMFYEAFTHTKDMKKMQSGFLIKNIFDNFKSKTLSFVKPYRSLWIYAAHDLTMTNVLNFLNLYNDKHVPPYASSFYFELYKRDSEYFVQFSYRRTPMDQVPPLEIPGCDIMCPLKQLYEIYKDTLPTDFEDHANLCQLKE